MEIECHLHIPKLFLVNLNLFHFIPGYIAAQKDLWVVGDTFVDEVFNTLQELKADASSGKKQMLYLYDYYNVSFKMDEKLSNMNNSLAHIINVVIKNLSTTAPVPRIILIMTDFDILRQIKHFGFGVSQVIGSILDWLINNMECAIAVKTDYVRRKRLGALHSGEPKIIWLKIFDRPADAMLPYMLTA